MSPAEIILLIVAIAFVVLVIFSSILIVRTCQALKDVSNLSADLRYKMQCLNPMFNSLSNLGEGLQERTRFCKEDAQLRNLKAALNQNEPRDSSPVPEIMECAILGLRAWNKLKKG